MISGNYSTNPKRAKLNCGSAFAPSEAETTPSYSLPNSIHTTPMADNGILNTVNLEGSPLQKNTNNI